MPWLIFEVIDLLLLLMSYIWLNETSNRKYITSIILAYTKLNLKNLEKNSKAASFWHKIVDMEIISIQTKFSIILIIFHKNILIMFKYFLKINNRARKIYWGALFPGHIERFYMWPGVRKCDHAPIITRPVFNLRPRLCFLKIKKTFDLNEHNQSSDAYFWLANPA